VINNSHLTAVSRKLPAVPLRWLFKQGRLKGWVLDYGCGKSHKVNQQLCPMDGYDPFYRPYGICLANYYTITCNYVLNVIPDEFERLNLNG